jgi:hypothetical protein
MYTLHAIYHPCMSPPIPFLPCRSTQTSSSSTEMVGVPVLPK